MASNDEAVAGCLVIFLWGIFSWAAGGVMGMLVAYFIWRH